MRVSAFPIGLALAAAAPVAGPLSRPARARAERHQADIVCGTSIGALIGGVYLGGRLDELEAWARRLNRLRLSRLFDLSARLWRPDHGPADHGDLRRRAKACAIEDLPARFACVTTEYGTGHEVWLQNGNLLERYAPPMRCPAFPPVKIDAAGCSTARSSTRPRPGVPGARRRIVIAVNSQRCLWSRRRRDGDRACRGAG